MTRARTLADLGSASLATDAEVTAAIDAIPPAKGKNLLYNGAMQVTQRGTSTASIASAGYYTADRYHTVATNQGTWTQSVENDAPTGSGFSKSLKMLCTTADAAPSASDQLRVRHILEGQDLQRISKGTSAAKELTLSFWVKSNVTGTYIAEANDFDNSRMVCAAYTISASATWEKKTITFPADTTGAFDNDNGASLYLSFWLGAGSNFTSGTLPTVWESSTTANRAVGQTNLAAATSNYWQITGVQLEVGDTATEFEFKSYGQELAECQRYYWQSTLNRSMVHARSANQVFCTNNHPVTMRSTPSLSSSFTTRAGSVPTLPNQIMLAGGGGVLGASGTAGFFVDGATTNSATFILNGFAITIGYTATMLTDGGAIFRFDSEL